MSPLIPAEEVKSKMAMPDVVIVDARGGADAQERYRSRHVRNAVMVDLETDLSDKSIDAARGGRHPLPDPQRFGALLGKKGITPSTHVLVYDDKSGANAAARFWWMMRAIGHGNAQVIDGGLSALEEVGLPLETGPEPPLSSREAYPVAGWQLPLADIHIVDQVRLNPDFLVIDVREAYRYGGESEPIDLVAGHIPGAINIPYVDNLQPNGRFRSAKELADLYRMKLDQRDGNNVIVHCGSGVTACHTLLAMELAGLAAPRLYVGSWSEWSRNDRPIAQGQKP